MTLRPLVVALDGPASSGKSSVGAAVAREVGFRFCDTGLLYRAVTWLVLQRGIDPADPAALVALVGEVELAADDQGRLARVLVDGVDVTDRVHAADVDRRVSEVSRVAESEPRSSSVSGRSPAAAGSWSRAGTSARSCCPGPT